MSIPSFASRRVILEMYAPTGHKYKDILFIDMNIKRSLTSHPQWYVRYLVQYSYVLAQYTPAVVMQ